jgi:hypothetical protein
MPRGTWFFITVLTTFCNWCLFLVKQIKLITPSSIYFCIHSVLSSHLRLGFSNGLSILWTILRRNNIFGVQILKQLVPNSFWLKKKEPHCVLLYGTVPSGIWFRRNISLNSYSSSAEVWRVYGKAANTVNFPSYFSLSSNKKSSTNGRVFVLFTHQKVHYLLKLERFKIYTKIHTNIAPIYTYLGFRPSSGSLYWAWLKLY